MRQNLEEPLLDMYPFPITDLGLSATHQYSISPYTAIPGILRSSRTTQKTIDIAQVGMF